MRGPRTRLSPQGTLSSRVDLVVQGNPSVRRSLSRPSFPAFPGFPLWFPGPVVRGVPSGPLIRGCRCVPGFPSFQPAPGNPDLHVLLYDRGNLVIRSVRWRREIRADRECRRWARPGGRGGRCCRGSRRRRARPSARERRSARRRRVIQNLPGSRAGPCLRGSPVVRCVPAPRVWLPEPLRADRWPRVAPGGRPSPGRRQSSVRDRLGDRGPLWARGNLGVQAGLQNRGLRRLLWLRQTRVAQGFLGSPVPP